MKIAYLPIDERPCNVEYVERIARSAKDVDLLLPDKSLFGNKKMAADTERLWEWVHTVAPKVDAMILSMDMLIYGGLLPSRIHYMPEKSGDKWFGRLREFKTKYPGVEIYASNLIMRTPKYSSSDEEPYYYEEWGRDLFLRSFFQDKQKRSELTDEEVLQLAEIQHKLPTKYINDYETRRKFNLNINLQVLELVHEGVLQFLSVPQDDSAEYGYTAIDQKSVAQLRNDLRLYKEVQIYPGADEVGATLLSRAYNNFKGICPNIYLIWSSTLGPQLIPKYEDRPFGESLKAHVQAAGCKLVNSEKSADLILAYNTPGRIMQESWDQNKKDVTYTSFRNMLSFVEQITTFILSGKKVIIADSAFTNGGDLELIELLDASNVLDKVISYKGWNTNCNTLGTTICQGILGIDGKEDIIQENIVYHLIDDYFYQAVVRSEMVSNLLPQYNLTYFDLKDKAEVVNIERNKRLMKRYNETIRHSFKGIILENVHSSAPWNRMFECGLSLQLKKTESEN